MEYLVFRALVCFVQSLSARRTDALARGLGFVIHRCLPRKVSRHQVAYENLRTAFGDRYSDAELLPGLPVAKQHIGVNEGDLHQF